VNFSLGFQLKYLKFTFRHWLLEEPVRLFGSGRSAIYDVVSTLACDGPKNVWIPGWQCVELIDCLKHIPQVSLHFYELSDDLTPALPMLRNLDPGKDIVIIVDYFANVSGTALNEVIIQTNAPIIIDAVHSWAIAKPSFLSLPNITLVFGFRKLFWKGAGAVVVGGITKKLSLIPRLHPGASPRFPRNISLAPCLGFLSKILLRLHNLSYLDKLASSWPSSRDRGDFSCLKSPVCLSQRFLGSTDRDAEAWTWPDLSEELPTQVLSHAEELRAKYKVVYRP
jgi:hypothetical protein